MKILTRDLQRFIMIGVIALLFFEIGCISDEANRYYLNEKLPAKKTSEV